MSVFVAELKRLLSRYGCPNTDDLDDLNKAYNHMNVRSEVRNAQRSRTNPVSCPLNSRCGCDTFYNSVAKKLTIDRASSDKRRASRSRVRWATKEPFRRSKRQATVRYTSFKRALQLAGD